MPGYILALFIGVWSIELQSDCGKSHIDAAVEKEADKMVLNASDETKRKEQTARELEERKHLPKVESSEVLRDLNVSQMQILDSFSPTYEFDE